jgi:hypothetical protein
MLANALHENGQLDDAVAAAGRAVSMEPCDARLSAMVAYDLASSGVFLASAYWNEVAVAIDPSLVIALRNRERAYRGYLSVALATRSIPSICAPLNLALCRALAVLRSRLQCK